MTPVKEIGVFIDLAFFKMELWSKVVANLEFYEVTNIISNQML